MLKIKAIRLKNFCGYRDNQFIFATKKGINDISAIYGPNGEGKCILGNSIINTKNFGIIPISNIFNNLELIPQTWYNKEFEIESNGKWSSVKNIFYNGKTATKKIRTSSGYEIEGSADRHKILAVRNGNIEYVKLSDMKIGDFICIKKNGLFLDKNNMDINLAYLFGYLISEGHCGKNLMRFFNNDDEIINDFSERYNILFGELPNLFIDGKKKILTLKSKNHKIINNHGLDNCLSAEKQVPHPILSGTKEIYCAFLRAYFEGDGGIEKRKKLISCASKSEKLIKQIQIMLLRLGIISEVIKRNQKLNYTKKYQDGYTSWRLVITDRKSISIFIKDIGFISSRKKEESKELTNQLSNKGENPNKNIIPKELFLKLSSFLIAKIKELPIIRKRGAFFARSDYKKASSGLYCLQKNYINRVKLGVSNLAFLNCANTLSIALGKNIKNEIKNKFEWLDEYYFDTVKNIENGCDELYDVCVEEDHCFWSNGFINHNSSILDAIRILSSPKEIIGRDLKAMMKRYVYNEDYDPAYHDIKAKEGLIKINDMELEGIFETADGEEKRVLIEVSKKNNGIIVNELSDLTKGSGKDRGKNENTFAYYVDADNPINTGKFTLPDKYSDSFLDMAQAIYGYPCLLGSPVVEKGHIASASDDDVYDEDYNNRNDKESLTLYDDLVIVKTRNGSKVKVHYKRMSAGEKKIATLLRYLYNPVHIDTSDIILIDNVEMHVYFKRHGIMIDKILEHFPTKQFIVTSHSETMINHIDSIRGKNFLFNIEGIHELDKGVL